MDELKMEPLEPLEVPEPIEKQIASSNTQPWNFKRWILPACIVLGILIVVGIYLLFSPTPRNSLHRFSSMI